jgi:hypothetical protein
MINDDKTGLVGWAAFGCTTALLLFGLEIWLLRWGIQVMIGMGAPQWAAWLAAFVAFMYMGRICTVLLGTQAQADK